MDTSDAIIHKTLFSFAGSLRDCGNGEWVDKGNYRVTPVENGELFVRDPVTHKGNGIDAQPYWFTKVELKNPHWKFKYFERYPDSAGGCPTARFSGSGAGLTVIYRSELGEYSSDGLKSQRAFVRNLAIMKAQASLRKADASIPMMMKERLETLQMMKSYAGRTLDLIRRKQLKDVARFKSLGKRSTSEQRKFLAKKIADEHLMFVFGLLPLIEDLSGLAEHVMREEHMFVKGRGRHTFRNKKVTANTYKTRILQTPVVTRRTAAYSVRVSLRADVSVELLGRLQKLGFNPLYSVYDFTPLSFVVGWFSNFNFWVQSLDPLYGSTYRTGSVTEQTTISVEREAHGDSSNNGLQWSEGSGTANGVGITNVRGTLPSMPPHGSLELYNNFSFFSVTAGISLFLQRKVKLAQKAIRVKPFRYKSKKPVVLPPIKYTSSKNEPSS